ncbi:MAG: hypothetical protein AAEJ53_12560 [Myxococcota bacterium]
MMAVLFYTALFLAGLAWTRLARHRLGPAFCFLSAYPLGLLVWVLVSLVLALGPLPYDASFSIGALAISSAASLAFSRRTDRGGTDPWWKNVAPTGIAVSVFALLASLAVKFNLSIFTTDSEFIFAIGRSISHYGEIQGGIDGELTSRGAFQVLVQSASIFLETGYLNAPIALLAASTLGMFAYLGWRALDSSLRGMGLAILASVALGTTYNILLHTFYIHENLASGAYLLLSMACFFSAEREREPAWIPFAFAFLLAFALQRIENPLPALLFLTLLFSESHLPLRSLLPWALAWGGCLEFWYLWLLAFTGGGEPALRPAPHLLQTTHAYLILAALPLTFVGILLLRHPKLVRLQRHLPALALGSILLALGIAFFSSPEHMLLSAEAVWRGLSAPFWGWAWYLAIPLALLSLPMPRVPLSRTLVYGALSYLLVILLMAIARNPYDGRWADSATRMFVHILPLLSFYLLLTYGGSRSLPEPTRSMESGATI